METLNTDIPMDEQPSVETTPEQNPVETVEQPAEAADQQQQAQPNIHQLRKRKRSPQSCNSTVTKAFNTLHTGILS